jgi:hypothetical protein
MNSSQIVSRRMAYVAYRDNGNSVLRRHRGQERIVLNASDNADLGWGLDFSNKLCHQYSVSESPVARYASLYIDLPLRLEPSFIHVQPAARGRYIPSLVARLLSWRDNNGMTVCRSANSQYQATCKHVYRRNQSLRRPSCPLHPSADVDTVWTPTGN